MKPAPFAYYAPETAAEAVAFAREEPYHRAGLYEELVFRVLLVTAIAFAVRTWGRTGPRGALGVAVVGSALLFSLAHYRPFNPAGETFAVVSFAYRFVAGLAFSALYAGRGFGIAAWTHALYDVWVVVM